MTSSDEPRRVIDALLAAGYTEIGHGRHHKRLAWPDDDGRTLVVPLDPTAPEYEDLMDAVFKTLEAALFDGKAALLALNRINPEVYR